MRYLAATTNQDLVEVPYVISVVDRTAADEIEHANATGRTPVVFIHGLWLLPNSWDRWAALFEGAGYAAVMPGWPDDPETVGEARAHPEVFAHKTVGQVADHYAETVGQLTKKPVVIGHSRRSKGNDWNCSSYPMSRSRSGPLGSASSRRK
jgi:pimeloyl-ACP methyl ester carboxylesterase